jgi:2'-5' RNA ligase
MVPSEQTSAIIVRVPIPAGIERVRRRWDRAASLGVPPHVTILFPFFSPDRLEPPVRHELWAIAAAHVPFDVRFASVGRFPGLAYLAPEPAVEFTSLTEACVARFPDFQPYGGAHEDVVPHLTVVESDEAPMAEITSALERHLPFSHRVQALEVITPTQAGPWRLRWRLPLGRPGPRPGGPLRP